MVACDCRPGGAASQFNPDGLGAIISESSADVGAKSAVFDKTGFPIHMTDALGQKVTIDRDGLGRPTQLKYSDEKTEQLHWDSDKPGFLARMDDAAGSTSYQRDTHGRVVLKSMSSANGRELKVRYGYLAGGQIKQIVYPSGLTVDYQYTAGQVTQVNVEGKPFATGIGYSALGQPKAWNWSNGDAAKREFDADGRMQASEIASYTFDVAGRITGITQQRWGASRQSDQSARGDSQLVQNRSIICAKYRICQRRWHYC